MKVNGTQCGSPALRRRRFCFFHDKVRRERARIASQTLSQRRFDLPLLEDANSVQVALMKVVQMLGSGNLDHKTAGLMLYALQTASTNLRNTDFEVDDVTGVVIDPDTVAATCINGPQWFEEDFECENESEDEDDGEDEEEGEDEQEGEEEEGEGEDETAAAEDAAQPNAHASAKPDEKNVNGE
ncbi:MAG TPA: hypothetical protein VMG31_05990 [Verrucomicrobiae bacterium]|nr:hypothetical protein [Verrucomicrobiae bacterium]